MAAVQQAPSTGPNFVDAMEEEMRRCAEHLERRHTGRSVVAKPAKVSPPGDGGEVNARKRRPNVVTRPLGEQDGQFHSALPSTVLYPASSPAAQKPPSDAGGRNSEGAANSAVVSVTAQREEDPPVSVPAAKRVARPIRQNTFPRSQAASMEPATEDDATTEHKSVTVTIPANRWNTISPDRAMSPSSPVNPSSPVTLNPSGKSYSANRPQKQRTEQRTVTVTVSSGTLERPAKEEHQRHTAAPLSEGTHREGIQEKAKIFEAEGTAPPGVYWKGQKRSECGETPIVRETTTRSSKTSPEPSRETTATVTAIGVSRGGEIKTGPMAAHSDGATDPWYSERKEPVVLGSQTLPRQKDSIGHTTLLRGKEGPIPATRDVTLDLAPKHKVEPISGCVVLESGLKPKAEVDITTTTLELGIRHQNVPIPRMNMELNTLESPIVTKSFVGSHVTSLNTQQSTEAVDSSTTVDPQGDVPSPREKGIHPLAEDNIPSLGHLQKASVQENDQSEIIELRTRLKDMVDELSQLKMKYEKNTKKLEELLGAESREAELRMQTMALEEELRQQKQEMEAGLKLQKEMEVGLRLQKETEAGLRLQLEKKEAELIEVQLQSAKELRSLEEGAQKQFRDSEEQWKENSRQELKKQEDLMKTVRENMEQELKDRDGQIIKLSKDNNRLEREKWELLRRARDAAERMLGIRTQLEMKEGLLKSTQAELTHTLDELSSVKSSNTGLRTLLAELRASKTGVDQEVQVNFGGPLQRNRSIEMALNQGLYHDAPFNKNTTQDLKSTAPPTPQTSQVTSSSASQATPTGQVTSSSGVAAGRVTSPNGPGANHMTSPNSQVVGNITSLNDQVTDHMTPSSQGLHGQDSSSSVEQDSGVDRSPDFHVSSSTLDDSSWCEREPSIASVGSSTIDSRETTPMAERHHQKKKKIGFFEKFDKFRKSKRGSGSSMDGLDLSHSSIIQPTSKTNSVIPIGFPYAAVVPQLQDHWKTLEEFKKIPFPQWNGRAIIAWLEAGLGMNCYVATIREHVTSGHAMLALSLSDIEKRLGISNPLHRKKLWLAIEEQRNPEGCLYPCAGKIDHHWVAGEWASDCGFQHLSETLLTNMVDGRVLNSLTNDDLKRHLKISKKLDQLSFNAAVELLRMHDFNREAILEHRKSNKNPLYWSNRDVCDWLHTIHLEEYADYALGNSIHGALLFLERGHFTSEQLSSVLRIPISKTQIRKVLSNGLTLLFGEECSADSQSLPGDVNTVPLDCHHPVHKPKHVGGGGPPMYRTASSPLSSTIMSQPVLTAGTSLVSMTLPSGSSLLPSPFERSNRLHDRTRMSLRESALRSLSPNRGGSPSLHPPRCLTPILSSTTV